MSILRKKIKGKVYLYEKTWNKSLKKYVWRCLGPEDKISVLKIEQEVKFDTGILSLYRGTFHLRKARKMYECDRCHNKIIFPGKKYILWLIYREKPIRICLECALQSKMVIVRYRKRSLQSRK